MKPGDRVRVTRPKPEHQGYAGMTGEVKGVAHWTAPLPYEEAYVLLDHTSGKEVLFEEEELEVCEGGR